MEHGGAWWSMAAYFCCLHFCSILFSCFTKSCMITCGICYARAIHKQCEFCWGWLIVQIFTCSHKHLLVLDTIMRRFFCWYHHFCHGVYSSATLNSWFRHIKMYSLLTASHKSGTCEYCLYLVSKIQSHGVPFVNEEAFWKANTAAAGPWLQGDSLAIILPWFSTVLS